MLIQHDNFIKLVRYIRKQVFNIVCKLIMHIYAYWRMWFIAFCDIKNYLQTITFLESLSNKFLTYIFKNYYIFFADVLIIELNVFAHSKKYFV